MPGAPWPPTTRLLLPITKTPKVTTLPSARAAPGTSASFVTREAGSVSVVSPAPLSRAPTGRTTTSPTELSKMATKLLFNVSVKISVPATKATPSTMAKVLIKSRSLRPRRLFHAA